METTALLHSVKTDLEEACNITILFFNTRRREKASHTKIGQHDEQIGIKYIQGLQLRLPPSQQPIQCGVWESLDINTKRISQGD